jgi:DNA-binding XRE family transcriptional regulator
LTGAEFLAWRERAGFTQERAAARLGVTRNTIQNWETGQTGIPPVVETGCKVWERRLKQEDPTHGPVPLIYTSGPMSADSYGPRGPLAMMQQEALPTNASALGRVLELSERTDFHSPLIVDESHDMLGNAIELQRAVAGADNAAPTPWRWQSQAFGKQRNPSGAPAIWRVGSGGAMLIRPSHPRSTRNWISLIVSQSERSSKTSPTRTWRRLSPRSTRSESKTENLVGAIAQAFTWPRAVRNRAHFAGGS